MLIGTASNGGTSSNELNVGISFKIRNLHLLAGFVGYKHKNYILKKQTLLNKNKKGVLYIATPLSD